MKERKLNKSTFKKKLQILFPFKTCRPLVCIQISTLLDKTYGHKYKY